jgi:hypothetical protein
MKCPYRINRMIDPCRLPFDPEQLEIPAEDKSADFPDQPQGLVNNDPRQNNPLVAGGAGGKGGNQKSAKLTIQPAQGKSYRKTENFKRNGSCKGGLQEYVVYLG